MNYPKHRVVDLQHVPPGNLKKIEYMKWKSTDNLIYMQMADRVKICYH
jgi:hypothetical protein